MAQVRVWNTNTYDYRGKFKENEIFIPANKFIMMDRTEAVMFLGECDGIEKTPDGQPDPKKFKRLRIERNSSAIDETEKKFVCNACGQTFLNKDLLDAHVETFHVNQFAEKETKADFLAERSKKKKDAA